MFFCILCNLWILLFSRNMCAVSSILVRRVVQIGCLSVWTIDFPVFSLVFPDQTFLTIFVYMVILLYVLFPFRRWNCLSHLTVHTCVRVSVLLWSRWSCHSCESFSWVHCRPLICRLRKWIMALLVRLLWHFRARNFSPFVVSSFKHPLRFRVFLLLFQRNQPCYGICSVRVYNVTGTMSLVGLCSFCLDHLL